MLQVRRSDFPHLSFLWPYAKLWQTMQEMKIIAKMLVVHSSRCEFPRDSMAWSLICASRNWVIGSNNGLVLKRCQAITWTKDDLFSMGPQEHISIKFYSTFKNFKKYAWNIVWEMAAILFRPQHLIFSVVVSSNELMIFTSERGKKWPLWLICAVEWCYNMVQYNMILHTALQWLNHNIYQNLTHWPLGDFNFILDR